MTSSFVILIRTSSTEVLRFFFFLAFGLPAIELVSLKNNAARHSGCSGDWRLRCRLRHGYLSDVHRLHKVIPQLKVRGTVSTYLPTKIRTTAIKLM